MNVNNRTVSNHTLYNLKQFEPPKLSLSMPGQAKLNSLDKGWVENEGHHSSCGFIHSTPSNFCHHSNLTEDKIIIIGETTQNN